MWPLAGGGARGRGTRRRQSEGQRRTMPKLTTFRAGRVPSTAGSSRNSRSSRPSVTRASARASASPGQARAPQLNGSRSRSAPGARNRSVDGGASQLEPRYLRDPIGQDPGEDEVVTGAPGVWGPEEDICGNPSIWESGAISRDPGIQELGAISGAQAFGRGNTIGGNPGVWVRGHQ